ncbi:DUF1878 family protein [Bacillus sp. HMF5848]|uniref:DUF1878 family protein n=1 Tax=Bacillus sp. HMF5848 TaxID=2495421 RepID=UPI000F79617C|nr:DUF1878 family protein [Bacillus sp. HMF5848]RSK26322.1 DUF1878 family protein [Bacillus sp. HMF5848]
METLEKRVERLEYYHTLLLQYIGPDKAPFYYYVMECRLSQQEVEDFLQNCERLNNEYKKQKAEGFVIFTPLLEDFRQLIPNVLDLEKTIDTLLAQHMFKPIMEEFKQLFYKDRRRKN